MSYRGGDISIPVRSEPGHFWQSSSDGHHGGSLREKFAEERRRMEAEMEHLKQKFRRDVSGGSPREYGYQQQPAATYYRQPAIDDYYGSNRNYNTNQQSTSSSYHDTQREYSSQGGTGFGAPTGGFGSGYSTYPPPARYAPLSESFPSDGGAIQGFGKSPEWRFVETGPNGQKYVKLQFDMAQYRPDEIQVLVDNDFLKIRAKHEEGGPNRSCYREYNREFSLPAMVRSNQITSHLSRDGFLTVEAPLPPDYDNRVGFNSYGPRPVEYRR